MSKVVYETKKPRVRHGRYVVQYRTPNHGWWDVRNEAPTNYFGWAKFTAWSSALGMRDYGWEYRVIDTEGDEA